MSFERVQGKKVEERIPKAKCPNFILARTSRKVEILEQGKNFSGQCYAKLNRAVREVVSIKFIKSINRLIFVLVQGEGNNREDTVVIVVLDEYFYTETNV